MGDILQKLRSNPLMDSHHKMERFCVTVVALFLVLVLCWVNGAKIKADKEKLSIGQKAIYTSSGTFSLTKDVIRVKQLYRNSDYTKAFVLLKLEEPQSSYGSPTIYNLSTDVNDYKIYMTSANKTHIEGQPKATIYLFADTGYIGIYMVNSLGFNQALYDVIFRNTQYSKAGVRPSETGDSFARFNQVEFFFNFAGTSAPIAEFLEKEDPTANEIYSELLLKDSATTAQQNITQSLINMNNYMQQINRLADRLRSYNINVPALPPAISGDYITTDVTKTKDNPMAFDYSMTSGIDSIISTQYNITVDTTDSASSTKYKDEDSLYLVTDYVFPGGYQYNHQNLSLTNGIIDTLMADSPDTVTFREFAEDKKLEAADYADDIKFSFDDWYYDSGVRFIVDTAKPEEVMIQNTIQQYENAVRNLYNQKKSYQTSQLASYLEYEYKARESSSVFSIRSDNDTLVMYE